MNWFPHDGKSWHRPELDGLRGIAVLLVLLSHSSQTGWHVLGFSCAGMGKAGVYLFFVLSAFLLDGQIIKALDSSQASSRFWKRYAIRRFLRIIPLYWLAIGVQFYLSSMDVMSQIQDWDDVWAHVMLVRGKGVFWSIPVEFKYYVISPFLMALLFQTRESLRWITALLVLMGVGAVLLNVGFQLPQVSTVRFLPFFLVGAWFAFQPDLGGWIRQGQWAWLVVAAGLTFLIWIGLRQGLLQAGGGLYQLLAIGACFVIMVALGGDSEVGKRLFSANWLRWLGMISYSAYLFHIPLLHVFHEMGLNDLVPFPGLVFLLATVGLASLSHFGLERPLGRIDPFRVSNESA